VLGLRGSAVLGESDFVEEQSRMSTECRRCSECVGEEHHWLECFPDPLSMGNDPDYAHLVDDWEQWKLEPDAPEAGLYLVCKHCPAWKRTPEDWGDDGIACSGVSASWCPNCGDCTCPQEERSGFINRSHPDCPLHGVNSKHAEGIVE
jgi:hypothetical protein